MCLVCDQCSGTKHSVNSERRLPAIFSRPMVSSRTRRVAKATPRDMNSNGKQTYLPRSQRISCHQHSCFAFVTSVVGENSRRAHHERIRSTFQAVETSVRGRRSHHTPDTGREAACQIRRARLVQSQVTRRRPQADLSPARSPHSSYAISYDAERSRNVSHQVRQDGRRLVNETYNESWWNKHDK